MRIEKIEIAKLRRAEYNPRKELKQGDIEYEKLKRSIEEFGYVEPIIWNEQTGNVVGGHQRLTVLEDIGYSEVDCVVLDIDPTAEKALNVALNKIEGEWDNDKLADLLAELDEADFDITLTGFEGADIDEMMNPYHSSEAVQDSFDSQKACEEISKNEVRTKQGDIWQLGKHKLLCGNDINTLLEERYAQMAFLASPKIENYQENGIKLWEDELTKTIQQLSKHANLVCFCNLDLYETKTQYVEPTQSYATAMFESNGLRPIWIRVWKKGNKGFGVGGYHISSNKPIPQYEYVTAYSKGSQDEYNDQEYTWVSAFASHSYKFVKRLNKDERKKWGYAGLWEIESFPNNIPVELPWRCIKMHSDKGAIVIDPKANQGTTIIACEQLDRCCYALESDPIKCDAIVKRWEEFTGEKGVRL